MIIGSQAGVVEARAGELLQKRRKLDLSVPPNDPFVRRLSMYPLPPTGPVGTDEFEELAVKRLQMLKILEAQLAKTPNIEQNKFAEITSEFRLPSKPIASPENPKGLPTAKDRQEIRKDVLSHFVLRLAYRNPDKAPWLIKMESELLRLRFEEDLNENLKTFQEQNNDFRTVKADKQDGDEAASYYLSLEYMMRRGKQNVRSKQDILDNLYLVDFVEVLDLVAERKVFLRDGMAYIERAQLLNMILSRFRQNLQTSLDIAHKTFHLMSSESEDRVSEFLDKLPEQFLGKEFVATQFGDAPVELSTLDTLEKEHFPLCMSRIHRHVRHEHHLRHLGRLQYGLFLKGIGLTLEQSLEFWHNEFVIRAGEEGWKKKAYAYNIQYNYGQAGRGMNYAPYNCQKILSLPTGPGDTHGCPFRSLDYKELADWIGPIPERKTILTLAHAEKAYTEACVTFYRACRTPGSGTRLLSHTLHPNLYYLESRHDAERLATGDPTLLVPLAKPENLNDSTMALDSSTAAVDTSWYDELDNYEFDEEEVRKTFNNRSMMKEDEPAEKVPDTADLLATQAEPM